MLILMLHTLLIPSVERHLSTTLVCSSPGPLVRASGCSAAFRGGLFDLHLCSCLPLCLGLGLAFTAWLRLRGSRSFLRKERPSGMIVHYCLHTAPALDATWQTGGGFQPGASLHSQGFGSPSTMVGTFTAKRKLTSATIRLRLIDDIIDLPTNHLLLPRNAGV